MFILSRRWYEYELSGLDILQGTSLRRHRRLLSLFVGSHSRPFGAMRVSLIPEVPGPRLLGWVGPGADRSLQRS